ncbi:MAG: S8 family peptidase [Bdellovibrionales bacterium]
MKKTAALAVVSLGGMLALGCAPGLNQFEGRKRDQAPGSTAEAGVLVRGTDPAALANVLDRHPEAEFRILNEAHQMYEVFGLSVQDLQGELPQADVSKNVFIKNDDLRPAQRLQLMAQERPPNQMEKCVPGENPPQAVIEIQKLKEQVAKKIVPENSELRFSATNSINRQFPGQALRMAWIVMAPRGLAQREEVIMGATLDYKTVAMGGYGVGLIVQDSRKVCSLDLIEFAVTGNRDFGGRNPASTDLSQLELPPLPHLARLHAKEAWQLSQGHGQVIAVIDTGVNFNHVALRDNILVNDKEIAGNDTDDDGNGFVDDTVGWDFNHTDDSPFDDVGHGSHVAGLAASPVMGLAKQAQILPVKALGAFGGDVGSVAAAIRYSVDRGAKIINLSLGSHAAPKKEMVEAINYAEAKGVLLITAAGNGHPMTGIGLDTDEFPTYPAAMPNQNILNVASRGHDDSLALYSNFGAKSVDVAAPGGDETEPMTSTFLENPAGQLFEKMSGTSMAAPVVAGIAAQIWSQNPKLSNLQVKERLMKTGPSAANLKGTVISQRWVDALSALQSVPEMLQTGL